MENLLQVKDLDVGYGKIDIIKDINFTLKRGEILGIVGESGCGKSTLLKSIMQLMGTGAVVKKGNILFGETDMLSISQNELRKVRGSRLGVIFQNPGMSLNPLRKIKHQFIETIQSHKKVNKKEAYKHIVNMLGKLNLEDGERILNSFPFELSGGMNQRVAICLAMIMEPELILADEPTSALDVTVQAQVVEELIKLRDKFSTSMIIVSHNMGVVAKMADKIGVMHGGSMVEYGEKTKVLASPSHSYTKELLAAVPTMGGEIRKEIYQSPKSLRKLHGVSIHEEPYIRSS